MLLITDDNERLNQWLGALEARHLANLRVSEVTRALRALSADYVERRRRPARGSGAESPVKGTLDTAGRRAAFALFYAPLHLIAISEAVNRIGAAAPAPSEILDLGCGTGVAGAAWALAAGSGPSIVGVDRHPWALDEARWTYRQLGLAGEARHVSLDRIAMPRAGGAVVAAYVLNELSESTRKRVEDRLFEAAGRGVRVLVVEPIARAVAPWWPDTAARAAVIGGRADEWRFPVTLPPMLRLFDKAAGLDHRELTLRTLWFGG